MADLSFVQVAADSTGKRLRTTTVADGGSTMHQEIRVPLEEQLLALWAGRHITDRELEKLLKG